MTDATATGIAVVLVLVCGLYWKLAGMPARLWGVARAELAKEHAANDLAVQKALGEAVRARAAALLSGVRQYQEQLAADWRRQAEDARLKVLVADRHAKDTGTTLEAASELLREARGMLVDLQSMRAASAAVAPAGDVVPEPEPEPDDSRKTIQAPARAPAPDPAPAVELPPGSAVPPPPAPAVELPPGSAVPPPPAGAVQRPAGAVQRPAAAVRQPLASAIELPPASAVEPRAAAAQGPTVPRPASGNLKAALDAQTPSRAARALVQKPALDRVAEERRNREAEKYEPDRPSELTVVVDLGAGAPGARTGAGRA